VDAPPIVLTEHTKNVLDVVFSPDGALLASTSDDETTLLWDMAQLDAPPIVVTGHAGSVRSLAFDPNGGRFATSSNDRTVQVSYLLPELVTIGCEQVRRNMTEAEWVRYFGRDEPYRETCALP
jgi:WD40 repeat protein